MAVDDPLDFTPFSTMSTIQTKSEALNVIITSVLTVLILANVGSAVSKIVYFTRRMTFDYNAWLRAFIFANSDDPLRILSWLLGKYDYLDPKWMRARNHLRPSRLIFPLLARAAILLASIASVALSIPGEKRLQACSKHDYTLTVNPADAKNLTAFGNDLANCFDIPLTSELGSLRSSASYCYHPSYHPFPVDHDATTKDWTGLLVAKSSRLGVFIALVAHGQEARSLHMYVKWKDLTTKGVTYRSNTDSLDLEKLMSVAVAGLTRFNGRCREFRDPKYSNDSGRETLTTVLDNCILGNATEEATTVIESYFRNSLGWKPTTGNQRRIKVDSIRRKVTDELSCPFQVIVSRPFANIVPLTITLVLWCIVNVLVSYIVKKRGHNSLDAAFHLIKDVLGHDCTSNPLEENIFRDEVKTLNLCKWVCASSGGGGHFGYLGRGGDHPVDEFHHNIVVGGCASAKKEAENMGIVTGHPQIGRHNYTSSDAVQIVRPQESPMAPSTPTSGPHYSGFIATPSDNAFYPTLPVQPGSVALPHQSTGLPPAAYQYRPTDHQYVPGPHGSGYQPQG